MVIMLETFIVYHLFQNCQELLCGNLRYKGISPFQEKFLPQEALLSVSWHYYEPEHKRNCATAGAVSKPPLQEQPSKQSN
jgi:hypothetical protein